MNSRNSDLIIPLKDRHILIAVDESENAKRAVLYVADLLGGIPGFRITLLNIIPKPSEDFGFIRLKRTLNDVAP